MQTSSLLFLIALVLCQTTWTNAASTNNGPCFGGINNDAYLDWVQERGNDYNVTACYNTTSSDDTTQGVAIHWKIDTTEYYTISLAVAVRATGWVGFGLAEAGGMRGADMVIYETGKPNQVRDAHVLDERIPIDDVCQDWVYVDARVVDGFIIFEAIRRLDTMDTQDRAIINDSNTAVPSQLIIAAWGDTSTLSYHGPKSTVRASVRWYGSGDELTAVHTKLDEISDGYFDLKMNYTIQPMETEYVSFCFNWDPDIISQGVPNEPISIIAAEVITDETSARFVHHADVFGALQQSNASQVCLPEGSYGYSVYSWATGIHPFLLPDDVGYTFGPTIDNSKLQSFRIQIHYNNPELIENILDTTALRIYFSKTPRPQELGIMAMGDVLSKLEGQDIPAGLSQYDFTCTSDCSALALLNEPITVFQEGFHMHVSGVSAVTYHLRNNTIIREGRIDFYDFDQAGLPTVRQEPFVVMPGDSFISKFWFNSKNGTKFGQSSYEEMNKAVFVYYPAKTILSAAPWSCTYAAPISACNSSMVSRMLTSVDETERVFGLVPNQCSAKAPFPVVKTTGSSSSFMLLTMPSMLTAWLTFLFMIF